MEDKTKPFEFRLFHLFTYPFGDISEKDEICKSLLYDEDTTHLIELASIPASSSRIVGAMCLLANADKERDVDFVITLTHLHNEPAFALSMKRSILSIIEPARVNVSGKDTVN